MTIDKTTLQSTEFFTYLVSKYNSVGGSFYKLVALFSHQTRTVNRQDGAKGRKRDFRFWSLFVGCFQTTINKLFDERLFVGVPSRSGISVNLFSLGLEQTAIKKF